MSNHDTDDNESTDISTDTILTDGGIIVAPDDGVILEDTDAAGDRPDACTCSVFHAEAGLACWPCTREGFNTPAPREN